MPKHASKIMDPVKYSEDLKKIVAELEISKARLIKGLNLPDGIKQLNEEKNLLMVELADMTKRFKTRENSQTQELKKHYDKIKTGLEKELESLRFEIFISREKIKEQKAGFDAIVDEYNFKFNEIKVLDNLYQNKKTETKNEDTRIKKAISDLKSEQESFKMRTLEFNKELTLFKNAEIVFLENKEKFEKEYMTREKVFAAKQIDFGCKQTSFNNYSDLKIKELSLRETLLESKEKKNEESEKDCRFKIEELEKREKEVSDREEEYEELNESLLYREKSLGKAKSDLEYEKRKFFSRK